VQVPRDDAGCCTLANKNRDGSGVDASSRRFFYFCKSCRDHHNNRMTFNYRKSMDGHLAEAVEAAKSENTNRALQSLAMALQEMSCRIDQIEEKLDITYEGDERETE